MGFRFGILGSLSSPRLITSFFVLLSSVDATYGSVGGNGSRCRRSFEEQKVPVPTISACYSALIVRDRIARGQELPIQVPEGQKILGPNWGPA